MNSNQEKFSINWEDLKYLLEHAEASIRESSTYINEAEKKKLFLSRIQELKEKFYEIFINITIITIRIIYWTFPPRISIFAVLIVFE